MPKGFLIKCKRQQQQQQENSFKSCPLSTATPNQRPDSDKKMLATEDPNSRTQTTTISLLPCSQSGVDILNDGDGAHINVDRADGESSRCDLAALIRNKQQQSQLAAAAVPDTTTQQNTSNLNLLAAAIALVAAAAPSAAETASTNSNTVNYTALLQALLFNLGTANNNAGTTTASLFSSSSANDGSAETPPDTPDSKALVVLNSSISQQQHLAAQVLGSALFGLGATNNEDAAKIWPLSANRLKTNDSQQQPLYAPTFQTTSSSLSSQNANVVLSYQNSTTYNVDGVNAAADGGSYTAPPQLAQSQESSQIKQSNITPTPPSSPQRAFWLHPLTSTTTTLASSSTTTSRALMSATASAQQHETIPPWANCPQLQQFTALQPVMNHQQHMQLLASLQQQQQPEPHGQFIYPNIGMFPSHHHFPPHAMTVLPPGARLPFLHPLDYNNTTLPPGSVPPHMIPISLPHALLLQQQQQQQQQQSLGMMMKNFHPPQQQQHPVMMPISNFSQTRFLPAAAALSNGVGARHLIIPTTSFNPNCLIPHHQQFAAATNAEPHDDRKLHEIVAAGGMVAPTGALVAIAGGGGQPGSMYAVSNNMITAAATATGCAPNAIVVQPALVLAPAAQHQKISTSSADGPNGGPHPQQQHHGHQYSFDTLCTVDGRSRSKKRAESLRRSAAAAAGSSGAIEDDRLSGDGTLADSDSQDNMPRYSCSECGKSYATSSNLSRHKQTHRSLDSNSARKCPQCDKVYVSMPALSMHMMTHNMVHECTVCNKKFSRPWLLQGHLRSHTGEKPFGCAQCKKSFADRSNLRAHMQTHGQEKKFKCKYCGKSFNLKSYLSKHYEVSCTKKPGGASVKPHGSSSSSSSSSGAVGGDGCSSLTSEISLTDNFATPIAASCTDECSSQLVVKTDDDSETLDRLFENSQLHEKAKTDAIPALGENNEELPENPTTSTGLLAATGLDKANAMQNRSIRDEDGKDHLLAELISSFQHQQEHTTDDDPMSSLEAETFSMPANMSPSSYRIAADGELLFISTTNDNSTSCVAKVEETSVVVADTIITTTNSDSQPSTVAAAQPTAGNSQNTAETLPQPSPLPSGPQTAQILVKRKRGRPRKNPDETATSVKKRAKPTVKRVSLLPQPPSQRSSLPPPQTLSQEQQVTSHNESSNFLINRHQMDTSIQLQHAFNIHNHTKNANVVAVQNDDDDQLNSTILDYGHVMMAAVAPGSSSMYVSRLADEDLFLCSSHDDEENLRLAFPNAFSSSFHASKQATSNGEASLKRHRLSLDDSQLYQLGKNPGHVLHSFDQSPPHSHAVTDSAPCSSSSDTTKSVDARTSIAATSTVLLDGNVDEDGDDDVNDITTSEAVLVRADGGGAGAPPSAKRVKFRQAIEALLKAAEQLDN